MRNSKRVFIALLLADLGLFVIVGMATYGLLDWHKKQLRAESELLEEKNKVSSVASLNTILLDTKEKRGYLSGLFVDKKSFVDFFKFIESIGSYSGAKVSVGPVSFPEGEESEGVASVSFSAEGTWAEVAKTIALVDHIPIASSVARVQVVRKEKTFKDLSTDTKSEEADPSLWHATFDVKVLKTPEL